MNKDSFRELSQHIDQLETMAAMFAAQISLLRARVEATGEADGATLQRPLPLESADVPHHQK
ncbi:MAG: hypothetical protein ABII76_15570 [Pseudomonadota bacterium]